MEIPGDNHAISSASVQDALWTRFAGEVCGGIQRERRYGESVFRVGEAMGARVVGNGDRLERDEQRNYRPEASDTERWELQSRNGSKLRRRNHIGHSTTCRSDHESTVLVIDGGQAHPPHFGQRSSVITGGDGNTGANDCVGGEMRFITERWYGYMQCLLGV